MKLFFLSFLITNLITPFVFAQQQNCVNQKQDIFKFFPNDVVVAVQNSLNSKYHMGPNMPVSSKVVSGSVLSECSKYSLGGRDYNVVVNFSLQAVDDDSNTPSGNSYQMKSCLMTFKVVEKIAGNGKKWLDANISGFIDCQTSEYQLLLKQENLIF